MADTTQPAETKVNWTWIVLALGGAIAIGLYWYFNRQSTDEKMKKVREAKELKRLTDKENVSEN